MAVQTPRIFIHVEQLAEECRPAQVFRREHRLTLVWVDPDASLAEVAWWSKHTLTDAERSILRAGFGHNPDLALPPDDSLLDGTVKDFGLPRCFVLPRRGPLSRVT